MKDNLVKKNSVKGYFTGFHRIDCNDLYFSKLEDNITKTIIVEGYFGKSSFLFGWDFEIFSGIVVGTLSKNFVL